MGRLEYANVHWGLPPNAQRYLSLCNSVTNSLIPNGVNDTLAVK